LEILFLFINSCHWLQLIVEISVDLLSVSIGYLGRSGKSLHQIELLNIAYQGEIVAFYCSNLHPKVIEQS